MYEAELKKNQAELELKNKDIEHFALRIVEKNEFIKNIEIEVDTLEGTEKDKRQLLNLTNKIRNQIAIEREVYDIENKINNSYSGFFDKLNKKHPKLTKTEKKLCSLIALKLDNEQIATFLNITKDSVKKSKYLLKRKLAINSKEEIVDYFKTL